MNYHPYGIYVWHCAKCPGQKEITRHAHFVVSYDREWLDWMHHRIQVTLAFKRLTKRDQAMLRLEQDASRMIEKRKFLTDDVKLDERSAYAIHSCKSSEGDRGDSGEACSAGAGDHIPS